MNDLLRTYHPSGPPAGVRELPCGPSSVPPEHLFPALARSPHESLLLSGGTHPLSRFSFIGLEPFLILTGRGRKVSIEFLPGKCRESVSGDPFETLRHILNFYRLETFPGPPIFRAGGIGYLSYELARHLERLPVTTADDLELPEIYFAFYRAILCHERESRSYTLFGLDFPAQGKDGNCEQDLGAIHSRVLRLLHSPAWRGVFPRNRHRPALQSNFTRADYLAAIHRVLEYIRAGDIYQANISQRFHTPYSGDSYGLFLKLFEINPAPFFAYLDAGPLQVICSSPERFLLVQDDRVETRPIKGTLPRGRTSRMDQGIGQELLKSVKNRAELAMITDLLRNDLGRVCAYGSVVVEDPARLEAYTNVFHLVSIVTGRLAPGRDRVDLLRATFPGGSITGCPKIRAMEIIDELEPTARSVYTGSIGYLCFDGAMDLNIAIRTLVRKGDELYYQVGGGIVFDSDPQAEYEETLHKAASMREAVLASTDAGSRAHSEPFCTGP